MKCKKPFRSGLLEAGCGQCLPCRINRQRQITIRGLLEASQHPYSTFATLTYDDKHLPGSGSVSVRESQLFLKRLRYFIGPFRYILCGEYGERNWRPHYHAILYGVRDGCGVDRAWRKGFVHCSGVGPESIGYVAGYCLKGATTEKEMRWHGKNLAPEFVRWSRNPPIGAWAADLIGRFYTGDGKQVLEQNGDVSPVVRQDRKLWPIGRYLRARARRAAGLDQEDLSFRMQISRASTLLTMDQKALNDFFERAKGQSAASGARSEAKYKRMALEKKL